MEKVNEKMITISEEKMNLLNDMAYTELMLLNMVHGNDPAVGEILIDNIKDVAKMRSREKCTSTRS